MGLSMRGGSAKQNPDTCELNTIESSRKDLHYVCKTASSRL